MELLYNTRIKKPDISFPTNYSLAPITVIQNTEIAESSTAEILEADRYSAVYWLRNTLMIATEEKKTKLMWVRGK